MDEDGVRPPPGQAVRYGEIKALDTKDLVRQGIAAGNIYVQSAEAEVMELPQVRKRGGAGRGGGGGAAGTGTGTGGFVYVPQSAPQPFALPCVPA